MPYAPLRNKGIKNTPYHRIGSKELLISKDGGAKLQGPVPFGWQPAINGTPYAL